jgi:hypothetical protein
MEYRDPVDIMLDEIDKQTIADVYTVELKATERAYRTVIIDTLHKKQIPITEENISKGVMFAKLFEVEFGLQIFELDEHQDS